MKKIFIVLLCLITVMPVRSQLIGSVIAAAIKAIDLQIQKLQNKTIWLQNAQKAVENTMSKLKLDEIAEWVQKQQELYSAYYDELKKVKDIIAWYHRIKDITQKQLQLVAAYKRAYGLFKKDSHFTVDEIIYMGKVYTGILEESVKNLDQVLAVIHSFSLQVSDAGRIELINAAADAIDQNFTDLQQFSTQNRMLSLARSRDQQEIDEVKALYGLQ